MNGTTELFIFIGLSLHFIVFSIQTIAVLTIKKQRNKQFQPPFSVVICAHNELNNLKSNLQSILDQDYSQFELIVVLDRCDDESYDWLSALFKKYPFLRVISINRVPDNYNPKKYAITKAIELSQYEWILLTDADCEPTSTHWISSFAQSIETNTEIILGVGDYSQTETRVNQLIHFETFMTALNYFSFSKLGFPYMGVGRNLAYKRSLFLKTGFEGIEHITGGDDDLLIQRMVTKRNFSFNIHNRSKTTSVPKNNWIDYLKQKQRHLSVGKHYPAGIKWLLIIIALAHTFHWLTIIILISFNPIQWNLVIFTGFIILAKVMMTFLIHRKLGINSHKWYLFPVLDEFYALVLPLIGIWSQLTKKIQWN